MYVVRVAALDMPEKQRSGAVLTGLILAIALRDCS